MEETEKTKIEEALKESREQLKIIAETAPLPICVTRISDAVLLFVNDAYKSMFGFEGEELVGKKTFDFYQDPADRAGVLDTVNKNGFVKDSELKLKRRDGRPFRASATIRIISYAGEQAYLAVLTDITERKETEEKLLKSEERHKNLVKYAPAAIYEIDLKTMGFAEVNDTMCDMLGYTREELLAMKPGDLLDEEGRNRFGERMARVLAGNDIPEQTEYKARTKDGNEIWAVLRVSVNYDNGKPLSISVVAHDVTERKKAEETQRESEEKYRQIVETTNEGIWTSDIDRKTIYVNHRMAEMLGYTADEMIGRNAQEFLAGDQTELALETRKKLQAGEARQVELKYKRKDGSFIWVMANASPVIDREGRTIGAISMITDITSRKQDEEALRESEERFRIVAENAPIGIAMTRVSDAKVIFANPAYHRMMGVEQGELTGKKSPDFYADPVDRENIINIMQKQGRVNNYPNKLKKADGSIIWVSSSAHFMEYKGEQVILGSSVDITDARKKELELDKINRILKAHNDLEHAMVHSKDEPGYLEDACRIIINDCGYKMAWVGFKEEDEAKSVRPVSQAGFEEGYLKTLNVTWADTDRGRGPTGTAVRTGKTSMCRNMLTDPCFDPWRAEALKRGYASSIAIPMVSERKIAGALTIYSPEPDPFSEDEVKLLEELADDLSYGIIYIRTREKNSRAEEEIRRAASFPELNPNPICEIDFDGNLLYSNPSFKKLFPDAGEKNFSHPFFSGLASLVKSFKQKKDAFITREIKSGERWYDQTIVHVPDSWSLRFYGRDITSRKKVEEQIRELYGDLENRVHERTADLMRTSKKLSKEVRTRREAEKKILVRNELLGLMSNASSRKEYMEDLNKIIGRLCGCGCHGIRMLDTKGNIPFETYTGYTEKFWESENWLSVNSDRCVCTRVIKGRLEPMDRPLATKTGAFYCGDMGKFVKNLTKKQASGLRGECIRCGYMSLAVIPIKYGNKMIGAIHLADKRKNILPKELVGLLESLTPLIGEGIKKFNISDDMKQTNELMEKIFSSGDFSIAYMDADFNCIKVNSAFAAADGHNPDFFTGKNYFTLYPDEEIREIFRKVVETGEPYFAYAKSFAHAKSSWHGETFWNISLQPVTDTTSKTGKTEGLILVMVDVTMQKKAEEELIKAQKNLIDSQHLAEIGTLASTVAHELRNPLGVINVAAYNLGRKLPQDPDMQKHIANIEKKVLEGNQIITNLLTYAKMKMPVYKKTDLYGIIEECVDNAKKRFGSQGTTAVEKYRPIKGKSIYVDPLQIKEVYSNILNNAFQATEGKKGRVEIRAEAKPKGHISVSITDNGTGIEKDNLEKIFQPFYTSKSKGTGLGLAICRELVNLHNGRIEVDSTPGKGSTFTVIIPMKKKE